MKTFLLLFLIAVAAQFALADIPPQYSLVRINVPSDAAFQAILRTGVDPEGVHGTIGGPMEFVVNRLESSLLIKSGISYTIVVDDLEKENRRRLASGPFNALGFGDGSMGGFYTYAEMIAQLDSMHTLYPQIISARESIGTSYEGRALWAAKISLHPEQNDPGKPEVLYTAVHHAREPEGLMALVYYMWWLLDHYATDPEAAYLVNNRQIWFIPIVNPDGYVFNQTNAPGGGGMWRINRRPVGDYFGVDINRNYGPFEFWNASNPGSDVYPGSETYRGDAPFSESETQAIDRFMRSHHVAACLNYHTFGNYLIYPYGALMHESADSLTFREFAFDMVKADRYQSGLDMQTVRYATRGGSDDYMYGDASKPKTFAVTTEVGGAGDDFWPPTERILPLAEENLRPNIYYSHIAGQYTVAWRYDIADDSANGKLVRGQQFTMNVLLHNKGLADAVNLHVTPVGPENEIFWSNTPVVASRVGARSNATIELTGTVSATATLGRPLPLILTLTDSSGYVHSDTLSITLGVPDTLLSDDCENSTGNWNLGHEWGLTMTAHTGLLSLTDSPGGDYYRNDDNKMTLATPIDLSGYDHASLSFWSLWAIEPSFDMADVEITTDNGSEWTPLACNYMRECSFEGAQQVNGQIIDGYTPGNDWVEQTADLTPYVGNSVRIRFRVASDGQDQRDGWCVDDILLTGYHENVLAVHQHPPQVPLTSRLEKNYPNPFNPTTDIGYRMADAGFVSLKIFDPLGREVATLVNEQKAPGEYHVQWNAGGIPSGVYFYRLDVAPIANPTKRFSSTEKMILIK